VRAKCAQLDLSWIHTAQRWTLRASIDKVFDRQVYGTQSTADYIPLHPRRSLGLTATLLN
jgi:hypothetical protein